MQTISKATLSDIPEMVRIINAAYMAEAFCIQDLRTNEADIRSQMKIGQFFLAHSPRNPSQTKIVNNAADYSVQGSVFCSQTGERAYLGMLAVDPAHQGRGIAKILIDFIEQQSRNAGCRHLDLSVINLRPELLDFYARFGFEAFATAPFPAPEKMIQPLHMIQMRKKL